MAQVKDIMTKDPITLTPGSGLDEALNILISHKISHIPILDDAGHLVGIVSDRDVRLAADSPFLQLVPDNMTARLAHHKLGEVMQCQLHKIEETTSIKDAAAKMQQQNIGSLLVVDEQRKLSGIITRTDLIQHLIDILS